MSAYLIALIKVKDPDSWREYTGAVGATLQPFNGELVFRGRDAVVIEGRHDSSDVAVLRFADRATLDSWYNSAAYQAIVPVRRRAADMTIVTYDA